MIYQFNFQIFEILLIYIIYLYYIVIIIYIYFHLLSFLSYSFDVVILLSFMLLKFCYYPELVERTEKSLRQRFFWEDTYIMGIIHHSISLLFYNSPGLSTRVINNQPLHLTKLILGFNCKVARIYSWQITHLEIKNWPPHLPEDLSRREYLQTIEPLRSSVWPLPLTFITNCHYRPYHTLNVWQGKVLLSNKLLQFICD